MTEPRRPTLNRLLTANEVAWKLLEEANLIGWRTNGADGLSPIQQGEYFGYRPTQVEAFIREHLQTA